MKNQAFRPSKATIPSRGDNGDFVLALCPSTHRLLTHLPWDGVQPAAHKLSQMNAQAFHSSEAPSPSIRHDNVFTSHPCPRKPKANESTSNLLIRCHPLSLATPPMVLATTTQRQWWPPPWAAPAAPPDPPHAMLTKTTSEATYYPRQHVF